MTTPTHAIIGYLLTHTFIQNGVLPPEAAHNAFAVGILAANAPDIDCVIYWRIIKHRIRSPFHKPFLWALVLVPLLLFFFLTNQTLVYAYVLLAATGVTTHFIADSIDFSTGITWLWPLTNKQFHIWAYKGADGDSYRALWKDYKWSLAMIMELVIVAAGCIVYFWS